MESTLYKKSATLPPFISTKGPPVPGTPLLSLLCPLLAGSLPVT